MNHTSTTLPHFIIGGAQKAGTTSLHHILDHHPDIFIPNGELLFFSIDDPEENYALEKVPHLASKYSYEDNYPVYMRWYSSQFQEADERQILGEDSTTYLSSTHAPHRIASLIPEVKLIFLLRDPVKRTYSQYWHSLRNGRITQQFDALIEQNDPFLIRRSRYVENIKRYLNCFPREQLLFLLFEQFVKDPQRTVDTVCSFIGVPASLDVSTLDIHQNPARVAKSLRLQFAYNAVAVPATIARTLNREPFCSVHPHKTPSRAYGLLNRVHRKINPPRAGSYPPISEKSKQRLKQVFEPEYNQLSDLIGIDVTEYWTQ